MTWSNPDFVEITLNMEVTGYVNIDEGLEPTLSDASEKGASNDASEKRSST